MLVISMTDIPSLLSVWRVRMKGRSTGHQCLTAIPASHIGIQYLVFETDAGEVSGDQVA